MKLHFALTLLAASAAFAGPVTLYFDGPVSAASGAYFISGTNISDSDSFALTAPATITEITFGESVNPGATPETVDWQIGTSAFSSNEGSAAGVGLSSTLFCTSNPSCVSGSGDVYTSSFVLGLSLPAGTYWLTLDGATATDGDDGSWDGFVGQDYPGADSSAQSHNSIGDGTIFPEAFTISGNVSAPEPGNLALGGMGLLLLATACARARIKQRGPGRTEGALRAAP